MTPKTVVATWTEQARSIHDIVCQARNDNSSTAANDLQHQLLIYKPLFINLLDDIPKNTKDREFLQSGNAFIHGVERNVTKDFVSETIFLSDQLDINEWVAATLLTCGKKTSSRTGVSAIDTAVLLYYDEQLYLLAALDVILTSIKDASVNNDIRTVFHQFIVDLLATGGESESSSLSSPTLERSSTFISKLLRTNSRIKQQIESVSKNGGMVISRNNNTTTPATTSASASGGILGEEIIMKRLDRMTDERIYLVQILYHLSSLSRLPQRDIFDMLELLQLCDLTDVTAPYLMTALLAAISSGVYEEDGMDNDDKLLSDVSFINLFHDKLLGNLFRVPAIKAVVALQWCLFVNRACTLYPQVKEFLTISDDTITQLIDGAIETKAFQFLNSYILYFQHAYAKVDTDRQLLKSFVIAELENAMDDQTVDPTDFTKFNADIRTDFHPFVLFELENLVLGIIDKMNDTLRKLKYREEDSNHSVNAPLESKNALISSNDNGRIKDLEHFFTLLASIYRDRLNEGVKFWAPDNYLFAFIQWAIDIKVAGTVGACYEFFGSISTGDQCGPLAFQYLDAGSDRANLNASTLFSFGKLFATLHFYIPLLRKTKGDSTVMLPPAEEDLLIKFLYLLQQVTLYSTEARTILWKDEQYQICGSIMDMLKFTTSSALRSALYDVLSAFCTSWGGGINGVGAVISSTVWEVLEQSKYFVAKQINSNESLVDNSNGNRTTSMEVESSSGFLQEVELEQKDQVYPTTTSVVRLFATAIHTQSKRDELLNGFQQLPCTLPSTLGQETRTPGGKPYISLVIDGIFLQLNDLPYKYIGTKWQLSSVCLRVLENSLLSFDLQQLEELTASNNRKSNRIGDGVFTRLAKDEGSASTLQNMLLEYVTHPGYSVMIQVLSGGAFCKQLLGIVEHGVDGVANKKQYGPFFIESLMRSLRIIYRVLEIQSSFCNVLVPYVSGLSYRSATAEFKLKGFTFDALPTLVPLGQHILCQANAAVQIAMLMNCEDHEEICYLSTKILDALSTISKHDTVIKKGFEYAGVYAPTGRLGNKLAVVLDACKDAPSITYGIGERLEIEQPETISCDDYQYDMNNIPFWLATSVLEDTYNFDDDLSWLRRTCSVRIAILDLLLDNAATDKPSPSLTEFILGYMTLDRQSTQQLYKNDAPTIAFRAILDMMRITVDDGMDISEDGTISTVYHNSLIETHPILAEKCYQLIYRLCAKESTSIATLRHLRNEEEFFYKQFKALSSRLGVVAAVENPVFPGTMVCPDGSRIKTDFFRLLSMLHQRAWLLKSLALELHYTSGMQQKSEVVKLLNLLFGQQVNVAAPSSPYIHTGAYEQDLVKMLEMVSSLEFRWDDELMDNNNNNTQSDFVPSIFINFKATDYQIINERQCLVYDIRTIYSKLRAQQMHMQSQRTIVTQEERYAADMEIGNILRMLVAENHVREIVHGRVHCLRAWKQVVQVALTECFDYFPIETRQPIIHALLASLLPRMQPKEGFDTGILKALSELVSTLVIQLRGKNRLQSQQHNLSSSWTSMDIAYRLPDDKVVQLFVGILDTLQEESTTVAVRGDMYTALVNLLQYIRQHYPSKSQQQQQQHEQKSLISVESRLVDILSSRYGAILDTICNDACDGLGIWRTTAFTALNSLYTLTSQIDDTKFLSLLVRRNFLRYSVEMIRNDDQALLTLFSQHEAPLLPMYIYEAKVSLFTDVASTRNGAQLLLDNGILDVLGYCEFITARPKSSKETDKSLIERYDQLLLPTLRLIVTLLYSVGRINGFLLEKVESWVAKQQEALLYILRHDSNSWTLTLLSELKFVVAIMYYLSCRPGYFKNLIGRNLNNLHVSMVRLHQQLTSSDTFMKRIVPTNEEEQIWTKKPVSDVNATSIYVDKSRKLTNTISNYVKAYEYNSTAN